MTHCRSMLPLLPVVQAGHVSASAGCTCCTCTVGWPCKVCMSASNKAWSCTSPTCESNTQPLDSLPEAVPSVSICSYHTAVLTTMYRHSTNMLHTLAPPTTPQAVSNPSLCKSHVRVLQGVLAACNPNLDLGADTDTSIVCDHTNPTPFLQVNTSNKGVCTNDKPAYMCQHHDHKIDVDIPNIT